MAVSLKGDEHTASTTDKFANDVIAIFSVNQKAKWECLIKFNAETADL